MALIKEECNLRFVSDLFCHCIGFNVLDEKANHEILKRSEVSDSEIIVKLREDETSLNKPMLFKYKKQNDGFFKYIGYKFC